jgi:hypothetical protein
MLSLCLSSKFSVHIFLAEIDSNFMINPIFRHQENTSLPPVYSREFTRKLQVDRKGSRKDWRVFPMSFI